MDKSQAASQLIAQCSCISCELMSLASKSNFPGMLQAIVNYCHLLIEKSDIKGMLNYSSIISRIYKSGDQEIRFLIDNIFVRAHRGLKRRCSQAQWNWYYCNMPLHLKRSYRLIETY